MWAARLATAVEDREEGEELTERVLADPGVKAALEEVERDPRCWRDVMLSAEERQPRPEEPPREEPPRQGPPEGEDRISAGEV